MKHDGLPENMRRRFIFPSEVKPVMNMTHLLITASGGAVCLIRIEDQKIIFCGIGGKNPHSAEILPDGNIVSASSDDNILRLFNVSDGSHTDYHCEDAHGVVWDEKRQCLWSSCLYGIIRWEYDGENLQRGETCRPATAGNFNGHDIFPVYGEDKLFLAGVGVTVFDPDDCTFASLDGERSVKSISKGLDGRILVTKAKEMWWTDTLSIYCSGEPLEPLRSRRDLRCYKARWMLPNKFSYNE